jgi:hypothetical protein
MSVWIFCQCFIGLCVCACVLACVYLKLLFLASLGNCRLPAVKSVCKVKECHLYHMTYITQCHIS